MAETSARIARRRLEAILCEDRILLPAQDLKDDARALLRRLRDDHPKALSTGRARRIGDVLSVQPGGEMGGVKWSHSKLTTAEIRQVSKTVDAIINARGISDSQAQEELGWIGQGGVLRLRKGGGISSASVNSLRVWIRRWIHVL